MVAFDTDNGMIHYMSGIDEKTGNLNVYDMLPEHGDTIVVTNRDSHFEISYHHWSAPPLLLTEVDIERLKQGLITWN